MVNQTIYLIIQVGMRGAMGKVNDEKRYESSTNFYGDLVAPFKEQISMTLSPNSWTTKSFVGQIIHH